MVAAHLKLRHGAPASSPTDIPARGWRQVATRSVREAKADRLSLLAAGVAFFGVIAMVPALAAAVSIYGFVADPADVQRHASSLLDAAPPDARRLIVDQLSQIVGSSSSGLGLTAIVGVVIALWGASSGMKHLVEAVNVAYDEDETRGFVRLRLISVLLALGGIGFVLAALFLLAIAPAALASTGLATPLRVLLSVLRWPALVAGLMVGLAVLYRFAPDRAEPRWAWVSPGAVVATLAWLLASIGFSLYTSHFGQYNETYGSLGAVVVLLLWLFISVFAILFGAEVNAEAERQRAVRT